MQAERTMSPELVEGTDVPEEALIEVAVRRPDKLYGKARTNETTRHFYFDGQRVIVFDEAKGYYAIAPISGTIDEMVVELEERYGFTPPLADFVVNDPYQFISEQVRTSDHAGTETVNGVQCEHVTVSGDRADADLWIATDSRLPCRLVATFTEQEEQPKLSAEFSSWNLQAELSDDVFEFHPPEGAVEIEMVPVAELQGAGQ